MQHISWQDISLSSATLLCLCTGRSCSSALTSQVQLQVTQSLTRAHIPTSQTVCSKHSQLRQCCLVQKIICNCPRFNVTRKSLTSSIVGSLHVKHVAKLCMSYYSSFAQITDGERQSLADPQKWYCYLLTFHVTSRSDTT